MGRRGGRDRGGINASEDNRECENADCEFHIFGNLSGFKWTGNSSPYN
jgi:hypothetical protein